MSNSLMPPQSGQAILKPGFLVGQVVHYRYTPREHRFTNRMYWHLINIENLRDWSHRSPFRSCSWPNVYGLYDRDYVAKDNRPIASKLNDYLQQRTGAVFTGQVFLMTHPRFMNIGFNSVNFYFCYQQQRLRYIVSEINNTPWGEKQLYLHDCHQSEANAEHGVYTFNFDKCFHISPFVSMDIHYRWRFQVNAKRVDVRMKLFKNNETIMYVGMQTKHVSSDTKLGLPITVRRPAQAWKMWLNIYYEAARLWIKKVPFHNHPNS